MDLRSLILCLAALSLALSGWVYGWKFIKKRNYLLGLEWLVLGFSSANAFVYLLSGSQVSYSISTFFDAFSRGFGVPIVASAGLMFITHGYRPSVLADICWVAVCGVGTVVLVTADFMAKPLPYFYVAMWTLFSLYLVYFVRKLLEVGEGLHALGVTIALLLCQVIATIYDFYDIPGEEINVVFNFYTLALFTWSYMTVQLYYSYCALERAKTFPVSKVGIREKLAVAPKLD